MLLKFLVGGAIAGIVAVAFGYTEYKRGQEIGDSENYEEGITEMEKAAIIAEKQIADKKNSSQKRA